MKKSEDKIIIRNLLILFALIFLGIFIVAFSLLTFILAISHSEDLILLIIILAVSLLLFTLLYVFKYSTYVILTRERIIINNPITKLHYDEKWENFNSIILRDKCYELYQNEYYLICSYQPLDIHTLTHGSQLYTLSSIDIGVQLKRIKKADKFICISMTAAERERFRQLVRDNLDIIVAKSTQWVWWSSWKKHK